jgi:hypothetical protein
VAGPGEGAGAAAAAVAMAAVAWRGRRRRAAGTWTSGRVAAPRRGGRRRFAAQRTRVEALAAAESRSLSSMAAGGRADAVPLAVAVEEWELVGG